MFINVVNSVTFLLKAPLKNDVFLIGDFNNWKLETSYQLFKDPNNEDFWITIAGLDINTEYAYQYLIDDGLKIADPYAEKILDRGIGYKTSTPEIIMLEAANHYLK